MKPLEEIYGPKFFAKRKSLSWRAKPVCEAINSVLEPESVIDVGCAIGDYVQYWRNSLGVYAMGIEGSKAACPYFVCDGIVVSDLRQKINVWLRADLVVSFEVFEHIELEYTDQFLINLTKMSDKILASAAAIGQGGHYHVNCQPREYWIEKMEGLKYKYDNHIVLAVQELWKPWKGKKEMSSYYHNLLFFQKEASE